MSNYIQNTIFTEYAIHKINRNITQDYENFNFTKIRLGNKEGILDSTRTSLIDTVYTLPIDSVSLNNNIFTILSTIPDTIEGFDIREIGLYDTVGGIDNLFVFSEIDTTKPADLTYKLILTLDLDLMIVNLYPVYPEITILDKEYVPLHVEESFEETLNYVNTNLERIIEDNATEIGYNRAQVFYEKQKDINSNLQNFTNTSKYIKMQNLINDGSISDCFFNCDNNFLYYYIKNLNNYSSYLEVNNGLITSFNDDITFDNANGTTLMIRANLDKLSDGLILGKLDERESKYYFEFRINSPFLEFTLHSGLGYYTAAYDMSTLDVRISSDVFNTFIISFNNNFTTPEIKIYYNGTELTLIDTISNFTSLSYFSTLPLVNYTYSISNNLIHNNDFYIDSVVLFKRLLTSEEILLLNILNNF